MSLLKKGKHFWKKILAGIFILIAVAVFAIWYIFNLKFEDTAAQKPNYEVNGIGLLNEFIKDDSAANKKYTEKIITVSGQVSEVETADSTINIKMADTLTDAYIIFAFQENNIKDANLLKEGDTVSIKGSCSGGTYSQILETHYISFKRCILIK